MAFKYKQVCNGDAAIDEIVVIRHDDSTEHGYIDFVRVEPGQDMRHGETIFRLERKEAAALAYILENAGGAMQFRHAGSIAVLAVDPDNRIGQNDTRVMIWPGRNPDGSDPMEVQLRCQKAASRLYRIVGLL